MEKLKIDDRVAVYTVRGFYANRRTGVIREVAGEVIYVYYDNAGSSDKWDVVHAKQCRKLVKCQKEQDQNR